MHHEVFAATIFLIFACLISPTCNHMHLCAFAWSDQVD